MRIAVYSHYFMPEIGAPSARVGDFASQWLKAGHEVHVATCFPNHPTGVVYPGYSVCRYRHEVMRGINVHRSWTYVTPNKGFLKKSLGHASLWLSADLFSSRRMPAPDCVIGTSPTFFAAMAARANARRHRVPFIMEVRDLWPAIFVDLGVIKKRFMIRLLERWELALYRSATRIVTVTDAFRADLLRRGMPAEKVITITNGADTDYWRRDEEAGRALRTKLGIGDATMVLYIGAHGISQALTAQLRAAARLCERRDIVFVFVGEGAEKEKLRRAATESKLDQVRFHEPVDKLGVRAYYSAADICLVPLRNIPLFDTFIPSKMFEILAAECPIVASLRGEAADILARSGGAAIVPPEDDAAVAAAIEALAAEPARRRQMGITGRTFVMEHYARKNLAARYVEVITEARAVFAAPPAS